MAYSYQEPHKPNEAREAFANRKVSAPARHIARVKDFFMPRNQALETIDSEFSRSGTHHQPDVVTSHEGFNVFKMIDELSSTDKTIEQKLAVLQVIEEQYLPRQFLGDINGEILASVASFITAYQAGAGTSFQVSGTAGASATNKPVLRICLQFLRKFCELGHANESICKVSVFQLVKSCGMGLQSGTVTAGPSGSSLGAVSGGGPPEDSNSDGAMTAQELSILEAQVDVIVALTKQGREIQHLLPDITIVLQDWLLRLFNGGPTASNLLLKHIAFVENCVNYNSAAFDRAYISQLTQNVCLFACHSVTLGEITACLDLLVKIVSCSWKPQDETTLLILVTTLCKLLNWEPLCRKVWDLMKLLLGTSLGHQTVYLMCRILQSCETYPNRRVVRGCIFFLGTSLWGAERVSSLRHNFTSILPHFHKTLSIKDMDIAYEISAQLKRLVIKYGREFRLQMITWSCIFDILKGLYDLMQELGQHHSHLGGVFSDTMTEIESIHEKGLFSGSPEQLFGLVEYCSRHRSDHSLIRLLNYKAQGISPGKQHWLGSAKTFMATYFRNEKRSSVRIRALEIIRGIYTEYHFLYGDQLIEKVIVPCTANLSSVRNFDVLEMLLNLVVDICKDAKSDHFHDLITRVSEMVNQKLDDNHFVPEKHKEDVFQYLAFLENAVCGLLDAAYAKWPTSHATHALAIYELLTTNLTLQYARNLCRIETNSNARVSILKFLLNFRANIQGQVACGLVDKASTEPMYSKFILCQEMATEDNNPMSPPASPAPLSVGAMKLESFSFHLALGAFSDCAKYEMSWPAVKLFLDELPGLLGNRLLVLTDTMGVVNLASSLLLMFNNEELVCSLSSAPESLTVSDLNDEMLPALSVLLSYYTYFDKALQTKLVRAIMSGVTSCRSTAAVAALMICVLELPDIVTPIMKSLVSSLRQLLPATPKMAIHIIEFLSLTVRSPALYQGQFALEDYLGVFELLASIINPNKFNYYTVAEGYHVMFLWYLHCPIAYRPQMASLLLGTLETIEMQCSENDTKAKTLHEEAREVALSFFLLYMHSQKPCRVTDSSLSSFALGKANKSYTWAMGTKIVTISLAGASGSQGEAGEMDICEECKLALMGNDSSHSIYTAFSPGQLDPGSGCMSFSGQHTSVASGMHSTPISSGELGRKASTGAFGDMRRRHKSAIQRKVSEAPPAVARIAMDDSCIRGVAEEKMVMTSPEVNVVTPSSSVVRFDLPTSSPLSTIDRSTPGDSASASFCWPHACNCLLSGWAEVKIRHCWGVTSWAFQLSGEQKAQLSSCFVFQNGSPGSVTQGSRTAARTSMGESPTVVPPGRSESVGDPGAGGDTGQPPQLQAKPAGVAAGGVSRKISEGAIRAPSVEPVGAQADSPATATTNPLIKQHSAAALRSHRVISKNSIGEQTKQTNDMLLCVDTSGTGSPVSKSRIAQTVSASSLSTSYYSLKSGDGGGPISPSPVAGDAVVLREKGGPALERFDPNTLFTQLFLCGASEPESLIHMCRTDGDPTLLQPVLLNNRGNRMERVLKNFDISYPAYATRKVGVVYVGPGQKAEAEILQNQAGSARYENFLAALGDVIRLKDAWPLEIFTGGLDSSGKDEDGKFALFWHNPITQLIFHVATLMPSKADVDPNCNMKKRHIGNDFVTIVFDESGGDYQLGTITGQFNYVAIVVKPVDRFMLSVSLKAKDEISRWLALKKVVVSDDAAPILCRQMSLRAELSCKVWSQSRDNSDSPFVSKAIDRLREIRYIREKHAL